MKYRIVMKMCSNQKEAEKMLATVKDKARSPFVNYNNNTRSWYVVLSEVDGRDKADEAYSWFRSKGLQIFIQKMAGDNNE